MRRAQRNDRPCTACSSPFARPPPIRAQLLAVMGGVPGARWQDDEQLHLTLRFIGEVDRPLAEDIAAALGQVRCPAIDVALAGVGRFDKARARQCDLGRRRARTSHSRSSTARSITRWSAGLAPERPRLSAAHHPRAAAAQRRRGAQVDRFLADHAGLASAPFALDAFDAVRKPRWPRRRPLEPVERWPLA